MPRSLAALEACGRLPTLGNTGCQAGVPGTVMCEDLWILDSRGECAEVSNLAHSGPHLFVELYSAMHGRVDRCVGPG